MRTRWRRIFAYQSSCMLARRAGREAGREVGRKAGPNNMVNCTGVTVMLPLKSAWNFLGYEIKDMV